MDTSLGNLSLMLNTDHYVVITHDQRHCEFYIHLHLSSFIITWLQAAVTDERNAVTCLYKN